MRKFGLAGYPLGHSFSKRYFTQKFEENGIEAAYNNFEIEDINSIKSIIDKCPDLEGFNVTIPHKQSIIPLLSSISKEAEEIGAVNCVRIIREHGECKLVGYNTDVIGFEGALREFLGEASPEKALVLGNGGAAKAVRYVLNKMGIRHLTVSRKASRKEEIGYEILPEIISEYKLIVNTTPLGTWPNIETSPDIPYKMLTKEHFLFDLVYNPEMTKFMSEGKKVGTKVCNGYKMLVMQAEAGWKIWNEK